MELDRKRILKDVRRCEEALHAAETLVTANLYADAVSRAYYAVIHAVMLFLAESGRDVRNPEEAESLFTPEFLGTRKLGEDLFPLFDGIRKAKRSYPYNYLYQYSDEDAREIIRQAGLFLSRAKAHFGMGE